MSYCCFAVVGTNEYNLDDQDGAAGSALADSASLPSILTTA